MPKTEGSIREIDVPASTMQALAGLRELQENLKKELGPEGYADYGLVICQANGRPVMTEHLNKKFKDILEDLSDPDIDPKDFVFHSLRHTSAAAKLALSHGDYNSVRHAGGWANLEMLTRRYGNHSFANDRLNVAQKMDDFLGGSSMENTASLGIVFPCFSSIMTFFNEPNSFICASAVSLSYVKTVVR